MRLKIKPHKLTLFPLLLLFFIAVGLVVYPIFASWYSEQHRSTVLTEYYGTVQGMDSSVAQAELESARQYNHALADASQGVNFSAAVAELPSQELLSAISGSTPDGVIASIEIPAIDVLLPIYYGTADSTLTNGIGVMEGTSLPVGGASSHSVLAGHSGLSTAPMLSDLEQLVEGDVFYINVLGEQLAYRVDQLLTVLPHDLSAIEIEQGCDYVTLVTCTPYGVNSHRLLVRGTRVEEPVPDAEEPVQEQVQEAEPERPSTWRSEYQQSIVLGLAVYAVLLAISLPVYFFVQRRKGRKG